MTFQREEVMPEVDKYTIAMEWIIMRLKRGKLISIYALTMMMGY